jgi:hypothetical protein
LSTNRAAHKVQSRENKRPDFTKYFTSEEEEDEEMED